MKFATPLLSTLLIAIINLTNAEEGTAVKVKEKKSINQDAGGGAPDFSSIPVPKYGHEGLVTPFAAGDKGNPFEMSLEAYIESFDKFSDNLSAQQEEAQAREAAAQAQETEAEHNQNDGPQRPPLGHTNTHQPPTGHPYAVHEEPAPGPMRTQNEDHRRQPELQERRPPWNGPPAPKPYHRDNSQGYPSERQLGRRGQEISPEPNRMQKESNFLPGQSAQYTPTTSSTYPENPNRPHSHRSEPQDQSMTGTYPLKVYEREENEENSEQRLSKTSKYPPGFEGHNGGPQALEQDHPIPAHSDYGPEAERGVASYLYSPPVYDRPLDEKYPLNIRNDPEVPYNEGPPPHQPRSPYFNRPPPERALQHYNGPPIKDEFYEPWDTSPNSIPRSGIVEDRASPIQHVEYPHRQRMPDEGPQSHSYIDPQGPEYESQRVPTQSDYSDPRYTDYENQYPRNNRPYPNVDYQGNVQSQTDQYPAQPDYGPDYQDYNRIQYDQRNEDQYPPNDYNLNEMEIPHGNFYNPYEENQYDRREEKPQYYDPYGENSVKQPAGGVYNPFEETPDKKLQYPLEAKYGEDAQFYNPYEEEGYSHYEHPEGYGLPTHEIDGYTEGVGSYEPYRIGGGHTSNDEGSIVSDIQVTCPPGSNTMVVAFKFKQDFRGRIYSKGYYDVKGCIARGEGTYTSGIELGLDTCGFKQAAEDYSKNGGKVIFDNVIVIMTEPEWEVLEAWDRAYAVRCQFEGFGHQAVGSGVTVPPLGVTTVAAQRIGIPKVVFHIFGGEDISQGPAEHLYVGQKSALAAVLTDNSDFDISVTNCRAHDGTGKRYIPLIDEQGCPLEGKRIIGNFRHERNRPEYGRTIVYAPFKAFKFPDRQDVYFECRVHVCFRQCYPSSCTYGNEGGVYRRKRAVEEVEIIQVTDTSKASIGPDGEVAEDLNVTRGIAILMNGEKTLFYSPDGSISVGGEIKCISRNGFVISIAFLTSALLVAILVCILVCLKNRQYWLKNMFDSSREPEPEPDYGFDPTQSMASVTEATLSRTYSIR